MKVTDITIYNIGRDGGSKLDMRTWQAKNLKKVLSEEIKFDESLDLPKTFFRLRIKDVKEFRNEYCSNLN